MNEPTAHGAGKIGWKCGFDVVVEEWDLQDLLLLFGIPEWSVDAELFMMNWRGDE